MNNPPFDYQLFHLNNFSSLTADPPENRFCPQLELNLYSRGMGALGLPGDWSSTSRFVKAAFTRMNSVCGELEEESVSQFFHILGSVWQQKGCVRMERDDGKVVYEKTIYSSCCNATKGIYYYITYDNSCIMAVDMHKENLDGDTLVSYPLVKKQLINWQN